MGLPIDEGDPPKHDSVAALICDAYGVIARGRQYISTGMGAYPAPISSSQIGAYIALNPCPVPIDEFQAAIYAYDEVFMHRYQEDQDKRDKEREAKEKSKK